jgi:heme-degrading monooxygenase HmoA
MIAVIFEFTPADGRRQEYFDLVAQLRAELDQAEGFLSIERFESLSTPGKFVSLQFWKDEASVAKWRNVQLHRRAQAKGRAGIFTDYRLRVAEVLRDYTMADRAQAPKDSIAVHGG